ncbi:hypothetical protein [Sphingobium sp. KCTC 72723]|uniref:hypothetical protein n=1 Tax=Sphingobium sp. KCTC 72723 TaxID=2733867 RepID=UPI00165E9158|nr:hypothetical protein [Sphingobium sp. KCTC 72723]
MATDEDIEAELAMLSDAQVLAIWLSAPDHEHPTRREEIAIGECERRGIDF